MPRDRTLLDLDMAASRALRVVFKHLEHLVHPTHVHTLRKIRPLLRARRAYEPAMLGGYAKIPDVSQVMFQERTITS